MIAGDRTAAGSGPIATARTISRPHRRRAVRDARRRRNPSPRLLDGHTLWNVNSTASGGGVAEMLAVLVGYTSGAGLDVRWLVTQGDDEFFAITKRIHNRIHGAKG